ncbi:unnamed protein product [Absidia cylindrospora]
METASIDQQPTTSTTNNKHNQQQAQPTTSTTNNKHNQQQEQPTTNTTNQGQEQPSQAKQCRMLLVITSIGAMALNGLKLSYYY